VAAYIPQPAIFFPILQRGGTASFSMIDSGVGQPVRIACLTSAFTILALARFRASGCVSATASLAALSASAALGAWPSSRSSTACVCSGTGATALSTILASRDLSSTIVARNATPTRGEADL
jgi:hypothetical protein